MTDKEFKVAIPSLYAMLNADRDGGCLVYNCEGMHTKICMDREQLGLISKGWSADETLALQDTENGTKFINRSLDMSLYSPCPSNPEFFNSFNIDVRGVEAAIQYGQKQENLFNQWLQIFPVVYTTNSVNTMKERNSLFYLCIYSELAELYLKTLYWTMIYTMLACCVGNRDKRLTGAQISGWLAALQSLYEEPRRSKERGNIEKAINGYVQGWKRRRTFPGGSLIYERYRTFYQDMKKGRSMIDEKDLQYEMAALHRLLRKTGEITGIAVRTPEKFIFAGSSSENRTHDIYDPISELLDAASKDPRALSKIMRRMNQMLLENGKLCTEDVEVLRGMASNS